MATVGDCRGPPNRRHAKSRHPGGSLPSQSAKIRRHYTPTLGTIKRGHAKKAKVRSAHFVRNFSISDFFPISYYLGHLKCLSVENFVFRLSPLDHLRARVVICASNRGKLLGSRSLRNLGDGKIFARGGLNRRKLAFQMGVKIHMR